MADKLLDFNGLSKYTTKMLEKFNAFVPKTRTINDKPLSDDIKLTYSDVGAQIEGSYVPTSRKINNKDLSKDITLTASDISGVPSTDDFVPKTRTVNNKALSSNISLDAVDIGIVKLGSGLSLGNAEGLNSLAIGPNTYARQNVSVAIGTSVDVDGYHGVGIGSNISILYNGKDLYAEANNVAIGRNITTYGRYLVGIGANISLNVGAPTAMNNCIAIGRDVTAGLYESIGIGNNVYSTLNCVAIGRVANASAYHSVAIGLNTSATKQYSTAIGYNAKADIEKGMQLGGSDLASLQAAVNLKIASDERDKIDIIPIDDGAIEFLKAVKTIRYHRNARVSYIQQEEYDEEGNVIPETRLSDKDQNNLHEYGLCSYDKEAHARGDKKGERIRVGVLAQNVQSALEQVYGDPSYGNIVDDNFYDYDPSTIPEGVENQLTIAYSNFIPFLIKAIQEQQDMIEDQKSEIDLLKAQISTLLS